MFSPRCWNILSLGALGLSCAIALNACDRPTVASTPSLGNQTVAMAQPRLTGAEINERLLSVLPPLNQANIAEAAAQPWNKADRLSPAETISLGNPDPVPTAQTVAPRPQTPAPVAATPISSVLASPMLTLVVSEPQPAGQTSSTVQSQAIAFNGSTAQTQYGHYPYAEAYRENLIVAGYYGSRPEQLHQDAAQAFQAMMAAAQGDGVQLMAVSGFRDVGIQSELFAAQTARQGSPERAARISAPPGHSEHHTGFAIDVGDEGYPDTDIEVSFEQTPAFRWMEQHAAAYGFELSFPRNNPQGVSYEPWHWRFVGSQAAQRVFAQAR